MRHRFLSPVVLVVAACALASVAIAGPPQRFTVQLGGSFSATGRTGSLKGHSRRATGLVVVRGRWNGGAWYVVTTTRTDKNGNYHFTITPGRRGTLLVRLVPPDKLERRYVLRVT